MRDEPFFIVGADRSGTTLLRLMLNAHPRIRIPRESQFLVTLMDAFPLQGALPAADLERMAQVLQADKRWRQWGVDDAALTALLGTLSSPSLAEVIDSLYRKLNSRGKPRWGDKTPILIREIGRLGTLFPTARFIQVVRDGRDVCVSLQQVGWWGRHTAKWAYYWQKSVAAGSEAGLPLGPSRYMEVKYEDLVLQTEHTLKTVCGFLGEDYSERMLRFYEGAAEEVAPAEREIHAKTVRPPDPDDVGRWPRELSPMQVAIVEIVAGRTLDYAGYPRRFGWLTPVSRSLDLVRAALGPLLLPARRSLLGVFPRLRHYI